MPECSWLNGKKICVTGGTGFLGSHLLPQLAEAGAKITCIARPTSDTSRLPAGVEVATCDLATGAGLKDALRGQDILIHMAALLFGLGWQAYLKANTLAARNIVGAIHQSGARLEKIIYVSSLAAAGPCATAPGLPESAPAAPVSAYGWSKLFCEHIFMSLAAEKLVVLRPPIIYGSGDRGLLPVFLGVRKRVASSPGARRVFPFSVIHASDAAWAIMLCCRGDAGSLYHLSDGGIYNMEIFCNAMAAALGVKPPHVFHVPLPAMAASAVSCSALGILRHKIRAMFRAGPPEIPQWNLDKYREASQCGWLADSGNIRMDLGFAPRMGLDEGMIETVEGYRARGWL